MLRISTLLRVVSLSIRRHRHLFKVLFTCHAHYYTNYIVHVNPFDHVFEKNFWAEKQRGGPLGILLETKAANGGLCLLEQHLINQFVSIAEHPDYIISIAILLPYRKKNGRETSAFRDS